MQKILFGIFAHPDDEAFGPCATLLREADAGTEIHLILLTAGAGAKSANPDTVPDLATVRLEEWQASAKLLGARSTHHLGYADGTLGNDDHIAIAHTIEQLVHTVTEGRKDIEIEFMTFDLNGLTGHIDHIVASRSACMAYYRLQKAGLPVRRVRLYCLAAEHYPASNTDFVFMEPGRASDVIAETVDGRSNIAHVTEVMRCHHSQRQDCDAQLARLGDNVAVDHFLVLE